MRHRDHDEHDPESQHRPLLRERAHHRPQRHNPQLRGARHNRHSHKHARGDLSQREDKGHGPGLQSHGISVRLRASRLLLRARALLPPISSPAPSTATSQGTRRSTTRAMATTTSLWAQAQRERRTSTRATYAAVTAPGVPSRPGLAHRSPRPFTPTPCCRFPPPSRSLVRIRFTLSALCLPPTPLTVVRPSPSAP